MSPSPETAPSPRSQAALAAFIAVAVLACAGFLALGVWQVKRLAWKEALIARIDAHVHAAPVAAPGPAAWPALDRTDDEYRRVELRGRYDFAHQVLVRATTELGAGYWVLTPLQAEGWQVLVNRGFIPPELRQQVPQGASLAAVVGLLRFSEPGGSLLQSNVPAQGRWYSRDVAAIATAQGLAAPVAPYFIDAQPQSPADARAWPRPGLTVIHFSNNHLQYALTWFVLAAMMAGVVAWLIIDERRHRARDRTAR